MVDRPDSGPDFGAQDDTGVGPQGRSTTGVRRWLKVVGIIILAVVLLLVIGLHLIGGGMGGPH
jgi:hypothetical protein